VPSTCLVGGGLDRRLLLRSLAPFIVIVVVPGVGCVVSAVQYWRHSTSSIENGSRRSNEMIDGKGQPKSLSDAAKRGLIKWLPLSLVLTFCFTPSVSASIFRAWHCVTFTYSDEEELSYLAQDLQIRCDGSPEHVSILTVAWPMVALWPVGSVVMYAALLIPCRFMLLDETGSTPLLRATSFLHRDYQPI
jgi:hypothetical protein